MNFLLDIKTSLYYNKHSLHINCVAKCVINSIIVIYLQIVTCRVMWIWHIFFANFFAWVSNIFRNRKRHDDDVRLTHWKDPIGKVIWIFVTLENRFQENQQYVIFIWYIFDICTGSFQQTFTVTREPASYFFLTFTMYLDKILMNY